MPGSAGSGAFTDTGGAERWQPTIDAALAEVGALPEGTELEPKGLTFVLHWRRAPSAGADLIAHAETLARRHGLETRLGKMSIEVLPPGESDKGSVVRSLAASLGAACFIGDDRGDLAAFASLGELESGGLRIARVAVASDEAPDELLAQADCVVEGPSGVVALLRALAKRLAVSC